MNKNSLVVPEAPAVTVTLSQEATQERQLALETAALIDQPITTVEAQRIASQCALALKQWGDALENTREVVKRPFLDACKLIDRTAKDERAATDAEAKRLNGLVRDYALEQERKIQAEIFEREKARNEALRIERDRIAAIEAEKERVKNQEIPQAEREAAAKSLEDLEGQQEEAEFAKDFEGQDVFIQPKPIKLEGAKLKAKLVFEVTDIHALYQAYPHVVRLEVSKSTLDMLILGLGLERANEIPGIIVRKETSAVATK